MNTIMAKSRLSDPIVLLTALFVGELIGKLVLFRTKVTIFFFVIAEVALTKKALPPRATPVAVREPLL
jgi:hypothetical protein